MNTSYNGIEYFVNTTGIPGGGLELFNITNINLSLQDRINVTYWFKAVGYDTQTWTTPYLFTNLTSVNTSLMGGLCTDLPLSTDGRGILGTFIIIIIVAAVGGTVRSMTAGGIIGSVFVLVFSFQSCPLLPTPYAWLSFATLTVLIVGDQIFRS